MFCFAFVLPPGIEPGVPVPQTNVLSIKLRERVRKQAEAIASICFSNEASERNFIEALLQ